MRIISKKKLKDFWESKAGKDARKELENWYKVAWNANWKEYADVKQTFGARFDIVGDCGVFDIRGNEFRLITRLGFMRHRVYILKVMTHKEYDKETWKTECGCFMKPPSTKKTKGAHRTKPAKKQR